MAEKLLSSIILLKMHSNLHHNEITTVTIHNLGYLDTQINQPQMIHFQENYYLKFLEIDSISIILNHTK